MIRKQLLPFALWFLAMLPLFIGPGCDNEDSDERDTTPPASVTDLAAALGPGAGQVDLTWTAVGDDGTDGSASAYILKYSTSMITEGTFDTATEFAQTWTPQSPGSTESRIVTGLTPGQTYYFALKVEDEIPNVSGLSNCPSQTAFLPDSTAPAAISDLAGTIGQVAGTVDLSWTAVGDDGTTGTAQAFVVKVSTTPIDALNFNLASTVVQSWTPLPAGSMENHTVTGLTPGLAYYFAVKTEDDALNLSPISNTAHVVPPALQVSLGANNPPGTSITPPAMPSLLQITVTAGPLEGVDISSITFTETGTGDTSKVQYLLLMNDVGPTPGQWDATDTYVDNTPQNFSGQNVTINLSPAYTLPAGTTENWILVYKWYGASSGTHAASHDPAVQITAAGATTANPITPVGGPILGNTFTLPVGVPAGFHTVGATGGPPALVWHSSIFDSGNNRALFFGGLTGSFGSGTNSVYSLSTASVGGETWTLLSPGGSPPPMRHAHAAVYDSVGKRMIVIGGRDNDTTTYPGGNPLADVWSLDLSSGGNGTWTPLSPTGNGPSGISHCAAAYDPTGNQVVLFGGYDSTDNYANTTYSLSLGSSPAWSTLTTTGTPAVRWGPSGFINTAGNEMIIFGGGSKTGGTGPPIYFYYSEIWSLNLSTLAFSQITPQTSPQSRAGFAYGFDSVHNRWYIFGGTGGGTMVMPQGDAFYFDLGTRNWVPLSLTGTNHGAGAGVAGAFDTLNNRFILHGGGGGATTSEIR